ncbi:ABC transporter permease [uncultured Mailhella sp.]|uniref:ABC transporter permease n=1 Tax=uncultured Mailhella sp. TaxID=1981031 RepID=UPI00260468F9|nr:ABC transporter permease [uncultured Mailhella sp.]
MKRLFSILSRYALAFAALLLLWQIGAWTLGPYLLPAPLDVLHAWSAALRGPDLPGHILSSARRVVTAMLLAFAAAFPLGLLLGCRRRLDRVLSPLVFLTYPLPKIVLLPVFLTLFGLGDLPKILLIALTTGYQLLVVTRDSLRHLDARCLDAFRTLGGTPAQLVRHVLVPAALPDAMTALKVASGTAVAVLFMAESFATRKGLGFLIMDAWGRGDQLEMFSGILSMSLLGLAVYETCHILEKVLCRWKTLEARR